MTHEVGRKWTSSPWFMDVGRMKAFSAASSGATGYGSGSANYHDDPALAQSQGWKTAVAVGMMPNAFMHGFLVEVFGGEVVYSSAELSVAFVAPVYAGESITAHLVVRSVEEAVDRGSRVTMDAWCENQSGTKVLVGAASIILSAGASERAAPIQTSSG